MNKEKEDIKTPDLDTNWNDLRGKIKKEFTNVTNEDLQFMSRGENELIGRLQIKSGRTKSQIRDWIKSSGKIM
ncbi:MAG: hypothetical protein RIB47_05310 [Cyclobacteriaceae bacterium]